MAKLKAALARYQARNALAQDKARKAQHSESMQEQKRAAQAARTRSAQRHKPAWLPFEDSPDARYLLIGEGDFSFAVSFMDKYPHCGLVATSLDSEQELASKYPDSAMKNVASLKEMGCDVLHNIDATQLSKHKLFKSLGDGGSHSEGELTVVFNFPHLGNSIADQDRNIRQHQQLLLAFFTQCNLIGARRVVVTLFDGMPYEAWQPKQLARSANLSLVRTGKFPWSEFESYDHQLTSKMGGKTHKQQKLRDARIYLWTVGQDAKQDTKQDEPADSDS